MRESQNTQETRTGNDTFGEKLTLCSPFLHLQMISKDNTAKKESAWHVCILEHRTTEEDKYHNN